MLVDRISYIGYFLQVLAGATFLLIIVPLYVWRGYLEEKSYFFRFAFVVLVQNAFLVNLVLFLGVLGICNWFTVSLSMVIFYTIIIWRYTDNQILRRLGRSLKLVSGVIVGKYKWADIVLASKTFWSRFVKRFLNLPLWGHIRANLFESVLLLAATIYLLWFLSYNLLRFHSYQFSDIPVHQSWVYALDKGTLFVDGVYPFAMHTIIYLIHKFFFADLREVLLYFGVFQTTILMLCLHILARSFFNWRGAAFISTIWFTLLLNQGRYGAALPQESGVFAMVLCAWCLLSFFEQPLSCYTVQGDARLRQIFRIRHYLNRKYFNVYIFLFMLAVSLVIAYHFYTAIGTVILVGIILIVFLFKMIKKQYWVPIIVGGLLGICIAIVPLFASYAKGIPFQESMDWAMSVIRGETWEGSEPDYRSDLESLIGTPGESLPLNEKAEDEEQIIKAKGIWQKVRNYYFAVFDFYDVVVLGREFTIILLICLALSGVVGIVFLFPQDTRLRGARYLVLTLYMFFMGVMGSAQNLGITEIIGATRAMTFVVPFLGFAYAMPFEIVFSTLDRYGNLSWQKFLRGFSVLLCLVLIFLICYKGWRHDFFDVNLAYYNEPDLLVKQIRKTYPKGSFTIVSTNEEYYQVIDYGYHENLSRFINMVSGNGEEYKIPTRYVFFFIEKRVLDDYYYGSVDVSLDLAAKEFVYFGSTQDYYFQRAVLQSKAYYWSKAFQKVYPNSFKVYFENDIYIAYMLEQNPHSLYNFQINYLPKEAR